jgi:hypothetical protein
MDTLSFSKDGKPLLPVVAGGAAAAAGAGGSS